jgi:hypothetical protein
MVELCGIQRKNLKKKKALVIIQGCRRGTKWDLEKNYKKSNAFAISCLECKTDLPSKNKKISDIGKHHHLFLL